MLAKLGSSSRNAGGEDKKLDFSLLLKRRPRAFQAGENLTREFLNFCQQPLAEKVQLLHITWSRDHVSTADFITLMILMLMTVHNVRERSIVVELQPEKFSLPATCKNVSHVCWLVFASTDTHGATTEDSNWSLLFFPSRAFDLLAAPCQFLRYRQITANYASELFRPSLRATILIHLQRR